VNIAVQTILKELKENGYDPVIATSTDPTGPSAELIEYATAVESDPVGRTRGIVAMCCKSGRRREDPKKVNTSNSSDAWGPDVGIRLVQLLRGCEAHWSLTFNMIDRLVELYPVSNTFSRMMKNAYIVFAACQALPFPARDVRTHIPSI
jgi:hypothetical protein